MIQRMNRVNFSVQHMRWTKCTKIKCRHLQNGNILWQLQVMHQKCFFCLLKHGSQCKVTSDTNPQWWFKELPHLALPCLDQIWKVGGFYQTFWGFCTKSDKPTILNEIQHFTANMNPIWPPTLAGGLMLRGRLRLKII